MVLRLLRVKSFIREKFSVGFSDITKEIFEVFGIGPTISFRDIGIVAS